MKKNNAVLALLGVFVAVALVFFNSDSPEENSVAADAAVVQPAHAQLNASANISSAPASSSSTASPASRAPAAAPRANSAKVGARESAMSRDSVIERLSSEGWSAAEAASEADRLIELARFKDTLDDYATAVSPVEKKELGRTVIAGLPGHVVRDEFTPAQAVAVHTGIVKDTEPNVAEQERLLKQAEKYWDMRTK